MSTFFLQNFGCRATDADATAIRHALQVEGFVSQSHATGTDVIVLNTCTVTAGADSQARESIRKLHRQSPAARIVVTGCYAQRAPEELTALDGVTCVVGNSHQTEIPRVLRQFAASRTTTGQDSGLFSLQSLVGEPMSLALGPAKILTSDIFAQSTLEPSVGSHLEEDRTRPILKIQDGCNNRCSYCVIPFVRGRSRSLPPHQVIAQVGALVRKGAKEIVLSGINLGSYGRDLMPRANLADLVRQLLKETALDRLRFSSIEPQDVTEDFVGLVATSGRIAPHFHIPLQSGSDRILRAMHRWYRAEHYAERIHFIHSMLPDAAIGADVIVGFPGESPEDFAATAGLIERLPFAYLHVFSFSERPGTEAAKLSSRVDANTIRERARHLRRLSDAKAVHFRQSQQGGTETALTLHRGGDTWTEALTGNYLKVRIAGRYAANQWFEARVAVDAKEILPASPLTLENHLREREIPTVRDC